MLARWLSRGFHTITMTASPESPIFSRASMVSGCGPGGSPSPASGRPALLDDPALMRRFVRGLEAEWLLAREFLPLALAQAFRVPGFAVIETRRILGQWVEAPVREIRLAARLILEHPWYAVVEVLKHEMAHQLAAEVLGDAGETAHGESFRAACRLLGVSPAASMRTVPLDEAVLGENKEAGATDAIVLRVKKLLALAGSPNRNEAERAMAKAHELMIKYNLKQMHGEHALPDEYFAVRVGKAALRHALDSHALATLLRDFYFVKVIWIPTYVIDREKMGRVLEICGSRGNVQLACYVHDYVRRYIEDEWRTCRVVSRKRNGKRDFALGVIRGFREVLDRQSAAPETRALVRAGDSRL